MTRNISGEVADARILRVADLGVNLLNIAAISFAALGLWRVGNDLNWAGDFVIQTGLLSHWQVWIGAAAGSVYVSFQLKLLSEPAAKTSTRSSELTVANGLFVRMPPGLSHSVHDPRLT